MSDMWLALGLGLLAFIEPCTMGSTLVLVKHLEQRAPRWTGIVLAALGLWSIALGLLAYFKV